MDILFQTTQVGQKTAKGENLNMRAIIPLTDSDVKKELKKSATTTTQNCTRL